jgi:hypothetical protein
MTFISTRRGGTQVTFISNGITISNCEASDSTSAGSAPVFDSCGVAGGAPKAGDHGFGAQFKNTSVAKQGDHGSDTLPPAPSGVVWTAGDVVEVSWTILAK